MWPERAYHGDLPRYQRRFFEGWYLKLRWGGEVCAVIPGVSVNAAGARAAFVQVITCGGSWYFPYPGRAFSARTDRFDVRLGENSFSEAGMTLRLRGPVDIDADLRFSPPLTPRRTLYLPSVMGPFAYLPFLPCHHSVLSLRSRAVGTLSIAGAQSVLDDAALYIEKDWGRSMPQSWLWFQCLDFSAAPDAQLVLSIARVPLLGTAFTGFFCVCRAQGREHRLATYLGGRVRGVSVAGGQLETVVQQGAYTLRLTAPLTGGSPLRAPVLGGMSRLIEELPCVTARVRLTLGQQVLLDGEARHAGLEYAPPEPGQKGL